MTVAELEPDKLTERATARQQLADAINAVAEARQRHAEAKRAAEAGMDRAIDLNNKIDALKERLSFMKSSAGAADGVVAALLRGDDLQAERSPAEKARHEINALQVELDAVRQARQTAEGEIENRKSAIGLAEMRVRRMVGGVLRASGATERLMAGLLDLEREVIRRRLGLAFLLRNEGVPVSLQAEVGRLLDGSQLPSRSAASAHSDWARDPTTTAWADALKALASDPDARLPV